MNRTNNYPQNIGDTIVLSESYSKYHFINIEVVNSGIFREYLIPTQELTQIENLNYKYNINGFILKPSKDGTTLSIVDIPKDGYKKLNIIAGILKNRSKFLYFSPWCPIYIKSSYKYITIYTRTYHLKNMFFI